jgi:hypothetical protein
MFIGLAPIDQDAAAGQIYAPMRRFVPNISIKIFPLAAR